MTDATTKGRKALCVGINTFRNYPGSALQGCVNDALAMAALLKDFQSFQDSEITFLLDEKATKANIMQHLQDMVAGARDGRYQQLVFTLSSHGTEVKDKGGDEVYDEAFCPHDLDAKNGDWDPDHIILDDELQALFSQIPAGVEYEVSLDTCHSGTGLRLLIPTQKARYLPPLWANQGLKLKPRVKTLRSAAKALNQKHTLWSACGPLQTSADAYLNGAWHGAFTYFLEKELRAASGQITDGELLKRIKADLKAEKFKQTPRVEYEPTRRR